MILHGIDNLNDSEKPRMIRKWLVRKFCKITLANESYLKYNKKLRN